jgi:hypothetical protein
MVRIESPRAFVHRSHSGHYGIVNSEEGYQNLVRFFFGQLRVDGILDIEELTLPPRVQQAYDNDKEIRASYQFEVVVAVRGSEWQVHRRTTRENSAIFRRFDELFPKRGRKRVTDTEWSPHLFSLFLDLDRRVEKTRGSLAFAFDLGVLVPGLHGERLAVAPRPLRRRQDVPGSDHRGGDSAGGSSEMARRGWLANPLGSTKRIANIGHGADPAGRDQGAGGRKRPHVRHRAAAIC